MSTDEERLPDEALVRKYLKSKKALVADPAQINRVSIQKILTDLGVPAGHTHLSNDLDDALESLHTVKPHLIFVDFGMSGRELLKMHESANHSRFESFVCVFATESSNELQCDELDGLIDAVFVKPLVPARIQERFIAKVAAKMRASKYDRQVDAGRILLASGETEKALVLLSNVRKHDARRLLAYFHEAHARKKLGDTEGSKQTYVEGLRVDPSDYHCLSGLFELLAETGQEKQAYAVAGQLHKEFPINPRHIPQLIRLALANGKPKDILAYCEVFSKMSDRDPVLADLISAGLVMCGKQLLDEKKKAEAIATFARAEVFSRGKLAIVKEIVCALLAHNFPYEANAFLMRAPEEVRDSPEVAAAELDIMKEWPAMDVLRAALDAIQRGIHHPKIYEIAIQRSLELKRRKVVLDELVHRASKKFPEKRAHYESMVKDVEAEPV